VYFRPPEWLITLATLLLIGPRLTWAILIALITLGIIPKEFAMKRFVLWEIEMKKPYWLNEMPIEDWANVSMTSLSGDLSFRWDLRSDRLSFCYDPTWRRLLCTNMRASTRSILCSIHDVTFWRSELQMRQRARAPTVRSDRLSCCYAPTWRRLLCTNMRASTRSILCSIHDRHFLEIWASGETVRACANSANCDHTGWAVATAQRDVAFYVLICASTRSILCSTKVKI
jgi:hypothetical protein